METDVGIATLGTEESVKICNSCIRDAFEIG